LAGGMNLTIRKALAYEISAAFNLFRDAAVWLKARNIDHWQEWHRPAELYKNWVRDGFENGQFFFVEEVGKIVGMFRLQFDDELFWGERNDEAGYIRSFTIKRDLSGHGIGYSVIDQIKSYLKDKDIHLLRLDCVSDNARLREYFENYGFKNAGTAYVHDQDLILYELTF
jgi:RimJ/RimL family protein N-acetyltransferase